MSLVVSPRSGFLVCLILVASLGLPCCLAYPPNAPMSLVGENAIIVWNAEKKVEHFVRQANFAGKADDFGFIVPTPTKPTVFEADEEAFWILEDGGLPTAAASVGETDAAAGSVEVIAQYDVGDFKASILKASDGASLNTWLATNGYSSRPAMTEWLDHYAKMDWHFAALKLTKGKSKEELKTKAVRVTFSTDVPFYPYKMPSDTWPQGHFRPLKLYFVANGVARAQYRGSSKNWEADVNGSRRLDPDSIQRLAYSLKLEEGDIPKGASVTVFQNGADATDYSQDLYFLTYGLVVPTWLLAVLGLGFAGFIVFQLAQKRRKLSSPSSH